MCALAVSFLIILSCISHIVSLFQNWDIYVSEETFWTRLRDLEQKVALSEGTRRGWYTYSDLELLLDKLEIGSLTRTLLTVSAACLTSYTASVLTLIGSALLVGHLNTLGGITATGLTTPTTVLTTQSSNILPATIIAPTAEEAPVTNITSESAAPAVLLATTLLTSVGSYGNFSQDCETDDGPIHCDFKLKDFVAKDSWLSVEAFANWLEDADKYVQTLRGWLRWSISRGSFLQEGTTHHWLHSLNYGNRFPIEVY